ncbi:MAG: ABC transporter ATP-binding protein [Halanaerobiaceae bacterium]
MIEYHDVLKVFNGKKNSFKAIDHISMKVEKGELAVLLGPSGCGKTTLLRLTNRLESLTEGSIKIEGKDISKENPVKLRQKIGYVIQEIGLFPNKTIAENIAIIPEVLDWDKKKIKNRTCELLEMLGLDPDRFLDKFPGKLSGGQRQRVGVARALAADPEIVLMDEPFAAIDPINRKKIQDQFLELQQELKKTIIFVTHDIDEAVKMSDKIAIINQGKLIEYNTPEEIVMNNENDFIEEFLGDEKEIQAYKLGHYQLCEKNDVVK